MMGGGCGEKADEARGPAAAAAAAAVPLKNEERILGKQHDAQPHRALNPNRIDTPLVTKKTQRKTRPNLPSRALPSRETARRRPSDRAAKMIARLFCLQGALGLSHSCVCVCLCVSVKKFVRPKKCGCSWRDARNAENARRRGGGGEKRRGGRV